MTMPFSSRVDHAEHLSTRQYARLVDEWVTAIGFAGRITARIPCGERRLP